MARTKAQKKEILDKLKDILDGAKSLVFVNIHGLGVTEATVMRKVLKKESVGLYVSKKTLATKAMALKKYQGSSPSLEGEVALAYGADLIAPARGIFEFQNKFKDKVSILGGIFEDKYMSKEEMTEIASIPPLKTLQGMFVNVINSPIQGLVMALDQLSKKKA